VAFIHFFPQRIHAAKQYEAVSHFLGIPAAILCLTRVAYISYQNNVLKSSIEKSIGLEVPTSVTLYYAE
jgi:hypothetical protein